MILPCRNGAATIDTQLDALARQAWSEPWELIVSDNGSTDDSLSIVERYRGRIANLSIVDSSDRRGVPHACNVAAAQARGRSLAFCNDDDEVGDGWLEAMGRALAEDELVAGRLEHEKLSDRWTLEVRGRPQTDGLSYWSFGTHLPFGFGCTLGVRRELHEAIGGFDEEMVPAGEDMDYCWRAQYAGAELRFVPDAVTHYRTRGALWALYRQAHGYGLGTVMVYKKHRALGMPEIPHRLRKGARAWLGLGKRLPAVSGRSGRGLFLWHLGWRTGMLRGSITHRVLLL